MCLGSTWEIQGFLCRAAVGGEDVLSRNSVEESLYRAWMVSLYWGWVLPSLEGLLTQNLRAQSPCRVYRSALASKQPAVGLFSQGCQILLLSWTGKVARAVEQLPLPLSREARSRTQIQQQFPPRQAAGLPSRLHRGHGDIAHQLQGSHNSFKTITLFI